MLFGVLKTALGSTNYTLINVAAQVQWYLIALKYVEHSGMCQESLWVSKDNKLLQKKKGTKSLIATHAFMFFFYYVILTKLFFSKSPVV